MKLILFAVLIAAPFIMIFISAYHAINNRFDKAIYFMLLLIAYILLEINKGIRKKWK